MRGNPPAQHQPVTQMRPLLLFLRVAPMHHHIDPVQRTLKEALISFKLQRVRHDSGGIRQHAVLGNNGIALDAGGPILCDHTLTILLRFEALARQKRRRRMRHEYGGNCRPRRRATRCPGR